MEAVQLLKSSQVQKLLQVDNKTLKKWRIDGTLPAAVSVKRITRYDPETIEQFVKTKKPV